MKKLALISVSILTILFVLQTAKATEQSSTSIANVVNYNYPAYSLYRSGTMEEAFQH